MDKNKKNSCPDHSEQAEKKPFSKREREAEKKRIH